jgi:hypothetical protein
MRVNKVAGLSAARASEAAERLAGANGQANGKAGKAARLTATALLVHAENADAARHDESMVARFGAAHPEVAQQRVPALATDVHDLASLRAIGDALAGTSD